MKIYTPMAVAVVAVLLTSCATQRPPQAFHYTGGDAVVIDSSDDNPGQVSQPAAKVRTQTNTVAANALNLTQRQEGAFVAGNNDQSRVGLRYRIRGTPWFVGLQGLDYEHVVFLQGRDAPDPTGLITLTKFF